MPLNKSVPINLIFQNYASIISESLDRVTGLHQYTCTCTIIVINFSTIIVYIIALSLILHEHIGKASQILRIIGRCTGITDRITSIIIGQSLSLNISTRLVSCMCLGFGQFSYSIYRLSQIHGWNNTTLNIIMF